MGGSELQRGEWSGAKPVRKPAELLGGTRGRGRLAHDGLLWKVRGIRVWDRGIDRDYYRGVTDETRLFTDTLAGFGYQGRDALFQHLGDRVFMLRAIGVVLADCRSERVHAIIRRADRQ